MLKRARQFYNFGPFRLDVAERVLFRGSEPVPLTPKAFDTLLMLVSRPGQVLDKEELMRAVWPDTFVEEGNLGQQIFQLRKALGDGANGATCIETVPRRGYRFAAEVKESWGDRRARLKKVWVLLAVGVLLGLAAVGYWRFSGGTTPEIRSLAVLPLDDLSGPAAQDYFAEGMTEALIIDLSKIGALRVISRPAVMRYKGSRKPPAEIARELKVEALVVGSVLRSGERVRITAQLIHPATDRQLWSESYERDLRDILSLQREVTRAIAGEIQVKLTAQEQALLANARPVNPQAYDYYLRGRVLASRRTNGDNQAAIELLERAVAAEPGFTPGYAVLAQACAERFYLHAPEEEAHWKKKAHAAVEKALSMDPNLAEAYLARGLLLWTPANGFPHEKAIHEFRRAVSLNPNSAEAHRELARVYNHIGLLEEGIEEAQRAVAINPGAAAPLHDLGQGLLWLGRYEQALPVWLSIPREVYPSLVGAQTAWILLQLGRKPEASATINGFLKEHPADTGGVLAGVEAVLLAAEGKEREAEARIRSAVPKKAF
ncbi:MAG: winged helix-turn-helix domain-containing protein, partial [Acidobacteriota bacterium]